MKQTLAQRRATVIEYFLDHGLTGLEGYKEAMRAVGYIEKTIGESAEIKWNSAETARLLAEERGRREHTTEKAVKLLEELKKDCETANDRTNRLGVIKELNRVSSLYSDEDGSVVINQVIVSAEERRAVLSKELKLLDDIGKAPLAIAE